MTREIHVRRLAELLATDARVFLLDVREPWEFELAALPGSVLIPLGELSRRVAEVAPEAGTLVVTVCHHGVRSLGAAAILQAEGVSQVVSLAGGIDAWSRLIDRDLRRY